MLSSSTKKKRHHWKEVEKREESAGSGERQKNPAFSKNVMEEIERNALAFSLGGEKKKGWHGSVVRKKKGVGGQIAGGFSPAGERTS